MVQQINTRILFYVKVFFSYICTSILIIVIYQTIMYAIVNISGKQFKVTKEQQIFAPKMQGDVDASVEFDQVLLADDNGTVSVGAPLLEGAKVSGKILDHVKGDKVIVFKKKRRKGYKKKNGHRQQYTKILIEDIVL